MKKKLFTFVPLGIAMLCIITNPSVKDFKDYLGENTYSGLHRTANLFFLSTYKFGGKKYIGFLGNFFWNKPNSTIIYVQAPAEYKDSANVKMDTSADYHSDPYKEFGGHIVKSK